MSDNALFLHKCPNCNATLKFNITSGLVKCEYCGSSFDVGTLITEAGGPDGNDPAAQTGGQDNGEISETFDWDKYKTEHEKEDLTGTSVYYCRTCGAEVVVDATTAASKCPYCDNNLIFTEKVSAGLRPNGVIPFKITPEELPGRVREFYKGKKLLPRNFFSSNRMDSVKGIYVPFWLYDCSMEGSVTLKGTRSHSTVRGDYRYVTTETYDIYRESEMNFRRIPVDGSVRMPDDIMDSLEPFDYSQIEEFNSGYLTGFMADRFDSDPDSCMPRLNVRAMNSAVSLIRSSVSGYSQLSLKDNKMAMSSSSVKYVMLPVYLFTCRYAGKDYQYAVNGQTGKVVGQLPRSKAKSWLAFASAFLITFLILFAIGSFLFGG